MKINELYRIYAIFMGKDLNHGVTIGYVVVSGGDSEVYKKLSKILEWYDDDYDDDDGAKERIIKKRGDYEEEYRGEFYDIKYRWEKVKKISKDEVRVLKKFKVLDLEGPDYCWYERLKK